MFRSIVRIVLALSATIALVLSSRPVNGCAVVGPRLSAGARMPAIEIAEESAIIIWDAATKTQHFIRCASFNTEVHDFGFLVPTPTRPVLAETEDRAFSLLERITAPERAAARSKGIRSAGRSFSAPKQAVHVLETKRVAGYDASVLEASDPQQLNEWLAKHGYQSSPEVAKWLEPYVAGGWKITAFKIAKDQPEMKSVATSAVRMTFHTDRPFFPYREPAGHSDSQFQGASRLLRLFVLAGERVQGSFDKAGEEWPGRTTWANKLSESDSAQLRDVLKMSDPPTTAPWWLTELEDRSAPRKGMTDLYFLPSSDQSVVAKPVVFQNSSVSAGTRRQQRFRVTFTNETDAEVSFLLPNSGSRNRLSPGETKSYSAQVWYGWTPTVGIQQSNGSILSFEIADRGKYAFRIRNSQVESVPR